MDWKRLIDELMASGMSQAQIAAVCETGQSHISALRLGKRRSPGWDLGQRLVLLHYNVMEHEHCTADRWIE